MYEKNITIFIEGVIQNCVITFGLQKVCLLLDSMKVASGTCRLAVSEQQRECTAFIYWATTVSKLHSVTECVVFICPLQGSGRIFQLAHPVTNYGNLSVDACAAWILPGFRSQAVKDIIV